MKVTSIKIHNILGIEDLEIAPKQITKFEGRNATGKTSAVEAIKAALKGGHDATLVRQGADEGEVVIILDDGMEIRKTVTNDKTDLSVTYPKTGENVFRPQSHLNALIDALSVNPVEFLSAPAKLRAEWLLQAMPLHVSEDDVRGIIDPNEVPAPLNAHAFEFLAAAEKVIYDERTGVNRLADEKRKTAKQLGQTLPNEPDTVDWTSAAKDAMQTLSDAKNDLKNAHEAAERLNKDNRAAIDGRCRESMTAAIKEFENMERSADKEKASLVDEYRRRLAELEAWRSDEYKNIEADLNAKKDNRDKAIMAAKDAEKSAIDVEECRHKTENTTALNDAISDASAKLAEAETKSKRQLTDNNTRAMIKRANADTEAHESEAEALTDRLEKLRTLKVSILKNLPIPGLTVEDGKVVRSGIPYDRLNTAQQIEIAVAVAKLRAGTLGVVCVDGLERLDAENLSAFETEMVASGLQCFVTRVSNNEFDVTTK